MSSAMAARPLRILLVLGLLVLAALALPGRTEAASFNEVKKLTASDAQAFDSFGLSVSVDGDMVVAGAPHEDAGGDAAGAAYLFQREDGTGEWTEVKKLVASDAEPGDRFGVSVALSGAVVVVGAWQEGAGGVHAGAAYVFERDQGGLANWGEVKKLTASNTGELDWFGRSVAVDGETILVGAPGQGNTATGNDTAYVFERNAGGPANWGERAKLTASNAYGFGRGFGYSVAISGDTLLVGAFGGVVGGVAVGAGYVYQRDAGGADNWGEVTRLTASDAEDGDGFGISVAISIDTVVVGAWKEDTNGKWAGAAYVFERNEGGPDDWVEVKKLTASDIEVRDNFGSAVAVSADTVLIGVDQEDGPGRESGAAYVFDRHEGGVNNWGEVVKLTASDAQPLDYFARSVTLSGDVAIMGAPGAGAAYVFDLGPSEPTPTITPTATTTPTPCPTGKVPADGGCGTPVPVGGISLDSDLQPLPLETSEPGTSPWGVAVGIIAAASLIAVGGAAWYARRRVNPRKQF